MTRAMLWLLLHVSPPGFRARCGDEFLAAYEWRLSRRRTPSDRLVLSVREVIPAMPSQAFRNLSDADLAAVIAFVRSRPRITDSLPATRLALPLRAMLVMGMIQTVPEMIDAGTSAPPAAAGDDGAVLGRYLAQAICTECHGPDLGGQDRFMITPDLAIVAAYSADELRTFFRTGLAIGDRELPTMSRIARDRYSAFADREIDALHAYLSSLPRARAAQD